MIWLVFCNHFRRQFQKQKTNLFGRLVTRTDCVQLDELEQRLVVVTEFLLQDREMNYFLVEIHEERFVLRFGLAKFM